jgi:hypothetical protein
MLKIVEAANGDLNRERLSDLRPGNCEWSPYLTG